MIIKPRTGARHTPAPDSVPHFVARARLDQMIPPQSVDYHKAIPANDDPIGNGPGPDVAGAGAGCCVEAWDYQEAAIRLANAAGDTWRPTASLVLERYSRLTGYDPVTGAPDPGTDTAADSADLCTKGIRINDQLLDIPFWTLVDPRNLIHVKIGIAHCGAVALTLNLPLAWQTEDWSTAPSPGHEWDPGSWEPGASEHRVGSGKYDGDFFTVRTWGVDRVVHPEAFARYVIAAELRISRTFLQATGLTPAGLDWNQLMADRARLAV